MITTLNAQAPKIRSVLRIVAALIFMAHGTQKIFGFPAGEFRPEMFSQLWIGGILEIVGGVLLFLGLYTRITAFLMSGMMAVAYFQFHLPNSLYPVNNGGDAPILYCFVWLYMVFAGPGPWSMDAAAGRDR